MGRPAVRTHRRVPDDRGVRERGERRHPPANGEPGGAGPAGCRDLLRPRGWLSARPRPAIPPVRPLRSRAGDHLWAGLVLRRGRGLLPARLRRPGALELAGPDRSPLRLQRPRAGAAERLPVGDRRAQGTTAISLVGDGARPGSPTKGGRRAWGTLLA